MVVADTHEAALTNHSIFPFSLKNKGQPLSVHARIASRPDDFGAPSHTCECGCTQSGSFIPDRKNETMSKMKRIYSI